MAGSYQFSLSPVNVPKINTKHRKIVTPIPSASSVKIIQELAKVEPRSMGGSLPIVWDRAVDYQVFDQEGNCWIDFTSTIFVANAGHSNPRILQAIEDQLRRKLLHNYCYPSEIRLRLIQKLIDLNPEPKKKAFLLSTGSEATECALKLMRMHGQRSSPEKNGIICFEGSMHGRTLGAQMMGGNPTAKKWIRHLDPEIYHLPFPWRFRCPWKESNEHACGAACFRKSMEQLQKQGVDLNRIAGFMLESYLGWGALFFPEEYVQEVRRWADAHNALVTFDEIQSGFGRTGKLFAFEHYNVQPDLICLGKGMSSSLPMSAVLGREDILDLAEPGSMSSTHTGNPLSSVAAIANIDEIKSSELVRQAQEKGKILEKGLRSLQKLYPDRILSIEGHGLLFAIHLVEPRTQKGDVALADRLCEKALQKGLLLVHTGRETIKIGPPLTIPIDALEEALDVLKESCHESLSLQEAVR